MGLRIKDGINLEALREYGFRTGKEYADAGERCLMGAGHTEEQNWYHKFLMDKDEPARIAYVNDSYPLPAIRVSIRTGDGFQNDLWVECIPCCTYHICGDEMAPVLETVYAMARDGLLEKTKGERGE